MILEKLLAAGIGDRPVVFVTHRYVWCYVYPSSYNHNPMHVLLEALKTLLVFFFFF